MITRAGRSRAEATDDLLIGPIGGQLLGTEHLAARARDVARAQRVTTSRAPLRPARLLARLAETRRILADAHSRLLSADKEEIDAGPAAEWLLDNYHVVQEHLEEVRASLPGGYYRELPELASGPMTGYPRVYEIAISLISHTEARVDPDNVNLYIEAFQSVTPLAIGELWAMPAMLRLGLIESVRRMTLRTLQRLDEIELAGFWSARVLQASAKGGTELRESLREFAASEHELTPHFVSKFLQLLRQTEGASPPLAWLEHWLRDAGVSPETSLAQSTHRVTVTQLVMANSIISLREIGRRDWSAFVETQSAMEAILRLDPSSFYARMTFATRDRYRHVIERIAKRSGHRETSVAQWAIELAKRPARDFPELDAAVRTHVGYYLIDEGVRELERMANYTPTFGERVERAIHTHSNLVFGGGLALLALVAAVAVLGLVEADTRDAYWLVIALAIIPAFDIAVTVLNQLVTALLPPRGLARLDLQLNGVPAEFRTAIVIPTLFRDAVDVRDAIETLEVQFLANRELNLHFVLLSDFTDANTESLASDAAILDAALTGMRTLRERYATAAPDTFFLLHRPRLWNGAQGVWMGWERKRGKLSAFNQLVRGQSDGAFTVTSGDHSSLIGVKYVITLDADTVLPPDAAPALIGAMAHPLNRAVFDSVSRRIIRGYGILQPRVGVSLPSAHRSVFAAVASGHPGVDPYSTAVSDVYQDLFGEGTFTGKGIYDVDTFETATHGRFPENTLLSHDLIEGNYARAGLASDIIVYDDYPTTYVAYCRRKHRWIRGDWQLLPWLRREVPGPDGVEQNRLSFVSQWKILDNLRRSTVELSQLTFLVVGWALLPGSMLRWTLLGLGAIVAPWVTALVIAALRPPLDKSWRAYYGAVAQDAAVSAQQAAIAIITLPHQAFNSLDAIVKTLYRLAYSRKMLLEWHSASLVERAAKPLRALTHASMRSSVLLVLLGSVALAYSLFNRQSVAILAISSITLSLVIVGIVIAIWVAAPQIMYLLSRPTVYQRRRLTIAETQLATRYALAHWQFFDRFVTEGTRWLAPDNFQSDPEPVVAMRTSPTNMGLQLLATVSAYDLGLIAVTDLTHRLERTFATLETLRKYRGHFYNWYDLTNLAVLEPQYISTVDSGNLAGHLIAFRQACFHIGESETAEQPRLHALANRAYEMVMAMDFSFLYDRARKLFSIGYHPESFTLDDSFYDLLATEARLASFIAIARDDVPIEHWFRLARGLTRTGNSTALASWSGSMFEYLMPVLVMRTLPFTLLDQTYRGAVERHISYARTRGIPWGVSESAYNIRDRQHTYQYRAFGVPDLALKRGLAQEVVVAPYASALAAQIVPSRALANLRALEALGALGEYGFCDALDYTRPEEPAPFALVRAYMAHHIGMTLVSLCNVLRNDVWQERFHNDALVKSVELLLHERIPRRLVLHEAQDDEPIDARESSPADSPIVREIDTLVDTAPRIALLGSVPYSVMINHSGSGFSRYQSIAVTRWRNDTTCDTSGQFCYVHDLTANRVWSSALQPMMAAPDTSRAWLASDRVTLHRVDGDIETRTEVTVVAADSAEVRRITLTNIGSEPHHIELTSYGEIAMTTQATDLAHPAFSNLFIETEWHAWCTAITATRRSRSPDDQQLWCVHVVDAGHNRVDGVSYETDRAQFVGRGRSVRNPIALAASGPLSGTTGPVLDPIFALRTDVIVAPGQSVSVSFTTLVATSREAAFELAGRYHDSHAAQRALDFAWTSTQIQLRELGITPANAAVFQDVATQLIYRGGSMAPPDDEVHRNLGSQPLLWAHGVSGDQPIVLAVIDSADGLPTLRDVFAAHRYWRRCGLVADLLIINAQPHDYLQSLRDSITEVMVSANDASLLDQPGGVFIRRREQFSTAEFLMLTATARVHITCDGRTLARVLAYADSHQVELHEALRSSAADRLFSRVTPVATVAAERSGPLSSIASLLLPLVTPLFPRQRREVAPIQNVTPEIDALRFYNGVGGVNAAGDYVIDVDNDTLPPAPWANVVANARGGFLVTERGAGCTWAENATFFRLTPWSNDPVTDPVGDCIYIQDDETGALWSATPAPVDGNGAYRVRHAAGVTAFEHVQDEIQTTLQLSVSPNAAVKVSVLRITNSADRLRTLTVTAYAEWTLGSRRDETQHQVRTRYVPELGGIFAQNYFDAHFSTWTAFLTTSEAPSSVTADRERFIGRNGHLGAPLALQQSQLNGATGVGYDPCAALQTSITLLPGETREITVLLGAASTEREARALIDALQAPRAADRAVTTTVDAWSARLSTISVVTPDPAFDVMLNKWSLYQALSCRMWARMGLYQSSGAYGFRDQLQDSMAFVYAEPGIARAHILRAAARQFVEGDVQHWWHAHSGRGVRTRFSDDLVWLPYVVDHYINVTGDRSVLDEYVPFLTMRALGPTEHELYDLPMVTDEHGSIYEHCRRALHRACTEGAHGLPLIGTGDWNDGMSRVGKEGRGESVWLAWFLIDTLNKFAAYADSKGDAAEAAFMRRWRTKYALAVEQDGWDGEWYRRAFYDNGTPIGSASSIECQIDSIAQSWSVIAGTASQARQDSAMHALYSRLVDKEARLIMLLTPPFDGSDSDPGYIRGYLPGVRENGGQYTHAALWTIMAAALRGESERAFSLFQMINPLTHSDTAEGVARYKVEPYVIAADVYTSPSHLGRGGWTWYTGSASWMYRVGLEHLLGFHKVGDRLRIDPCVPDSWGHYQITYRYGESVYVIDVLEPARVRREGARVVLDGLDLADGYIPLTDDQRRHHVEIRPMHTKS